MTVLLGKSFNHKEIKDFEAEHAKILRFTYHKNFQAIDGYTSDRRWGCAIRCSQSLLAQFIGKCCSLVPDVPLRAEYESLFFDLPVAPFGIHAFCREIAALGGKAGEWCKVSILAQVIKKLLSVIGLHALVAQDGMVSRRELSEMLKSQFPVLLLVPIMLGQSSLDKGYEDFVRMVLGLDPQSVGVVGGQQGKAFYMVGYQGDSMLYFDPHITLEAVTELEHIDRLRTAKLKSLPANELNSSMMVGFFVRSLDDVEVIPLVTAACGKCPIVLVDELPQEQKIVEDDDWLVIE